MIIPLVLLLLALLGAPLFAIIAASALNGFHGGGIDTTVVILEINRLTETPLLVAIPLFTFAGYLMGESNTPQRLLRLSHAALGWMPGGLAVVTMAVCAVFTALTGASGVTIIAMGALLYPALKAEGYPEKFTLGAITTSGSLGLLFPPAIPLILYGIIAHTSIDKLFAAGVIPGVLMVTLLSGWGMITATRAKIPLLKFNWRELGRAVYAAGWEVPLPVIVLGGIYSGILAISEAAAVTAFYVLVVEVFIYREIPIRRLPGVMVKSMTLVGGILIILGASLASTNYLIDQQVPMKLFDFVKDHISSKLTFLIILNLFLLVLGMILDIFSAIVLIVPLILPIATSYGVDPVHLGIIILANMQIGYCTPPVGMNLFIASYRFKQPVVKLYLASLPFLAILLGVVLIITYWPGLSLFLAGFVD
ncbi:MAG: TRAP transporter large permease subunit [Candidatus Lernaella stagnicola]|nr:TRAP transporter large permease subunit [Candidatus Lernaella stagnicola]